MVVNGTKDNQQHHQIITMQKLGLQQYLSCSDVSLSERLQCGKAAFLTCAPHLSTHQKEDVVVQWLCRLIREKQESIEWDGVVEEQERVWQVIAEVFSSRRLQALAKHHWTCPVTSAFTQSMIDVLGSHTLTPATECYIVQTVYSVLVTPSLASLVSNSPSMSLNLTAALLDIVARKDWEEMLNTGNCMVEPQAKKIKAVERMDNNYVDKVMMVEGERVLHALNMLLEHVTLQLLARADKEELMKLCAHQLLKRVAGVRIALNRYNGKVKEVVLSQLKKITLSCLFHPTVIPLYKTFLNAVMVEDSKGITAQEPVHIIFNICADIIAYESLPLVKCVVTHFYGGFLKESTIMRDNVLMLVMLLHMVGISVPGEHCVDENSPAISLVEITKVKSDRKEAVLACLLKCIGSSSCKKSKIMESYLTDLFLHLTNHKPKSADSFRSFYYLISMYPISLSDELPKILGHILTCRKKTAEAYEAYESLLVEVLQTYSKMRRLGLLLSLLLAGIVEGRDKLANHDKILPARILLKNVDNDNKEEPQRPLLPSRFVSGLYVALRGLEQAEHCALMDTFIQAAADTLLPLLQTEDGSSELDSGCARAFPACAWLLAAVVGGGGEAAAKMARASEAGAVVVVGHMNEALTTLILPSMEAVLNAKHDNGVLTGLLMLCRSWSRQLYRLCSTNTQFSNAWVHQMGDVEHPHFAGGALQTSLTPHTPPATWQQFVARVENFGDDWAKGEMVALCMQKIAYVSDLESFLRTTDHQGYKLTDQLLLATTATLTTSATTTVPRTSGTMVGEEVKSTTAVEDKDNGEKLNGYLPPNVTAPQPIAPLSGHEALAVVRTGLSSQLVGWLGAWCGRGVDAAVFELPGVMNAFTDVTHKQQLAGLVTSRWLSGDAGWRGALHSKGVWALYPQVLEHALQRLDHCVVVTGVAKSVFDIAEDATQNRKMKKRKRMRSGGEAVKKLGESGDEEHKEKEVENKVDSLIMIKDVLRIMTEFNNDEHNDKKKRKTVFLENTNNCGSVFRTMVENPNGNEKIKISYKDEDQLKNILLMILDIPLNSIATEYQTLLLFLFYTLLLNSDLSNKNNDTILQLILCIINSCMSSIHQLRFMNTIDLPCLMNRLVTEQAKLPSSDTAMTRLPVVEQMSHVLRTLFQLLINYSMYVEKATKVSTFIVARAKAEQIGQEVYLRPAWALVLVCCQSLAARPAIPEWRRRWCCKVVRTVAAWSIKLLRGFDLRTATAAASAALLGIYTALLRLQITKMEGEATERDYAENEGRNEEGRGINNRKQRRSGKHKDTLEDECVTNEGGEDDQDGMEENVEFNASFHCLEDASQDDIHDESQQSNFDNTMEDVVDGTEVGSKAPRWQRYLTYGVELARVCSSSQIPELESAALSFIITTKQLPYKLQQKLPAVKVALQTFTRPPQDTDKYIEAYKSADDPDLTNITSIQPQVMTDPITNKPISLNTLLADCPFQVYEALIEDLLTRMTRLDDGLLPHTAVLWTAVINTELNHSKTRVKRAALNALTRSLVWHLGNPPMERATETELANDIVTGQIGHKASVMHGVLELLNAVVCGPDTLPGHTVAQVIPAASATTHHLPIKHFIKVWLLQASLIEATLIRRWQTWPERPVCLLSAISSLAQTLVLRSHQNDATAHENIESLTKCGLALDRVVQKLPGKLSEAVLRVVHFTLADVVQALHETPVIAPVKSVLDKIIYKFFKMCDSYCLEHLLVVMPASTRPLLQHYHHNYSKYYAFDRTRE